MFTALLAWFSGARIWLDWLWRECWRQGGKAMTSVWLMAIIVIGWIYTACRWIGDTVADAANAIDAMRFPTVGHGSGPMANALSFINTILPLQELLGFVVAYIALRVALTIYRLVKSWIPTLS